MGVIGPRLGWGAFPSCWPGAMGGGALMPFHHSCGWQTLGGSQDHHNSKMALPTVKSGPPPLTVDTTIFEMWLGSLSAHRGLSIPVL